MQRNKDSQAIKEEIDQKAKDYLDDLEETHKRELEMVKKNPNQSIKSERSFVGYSDSFGFSRR